MLLTLAPELQFVIGLPVVLLLLGLGLAAAAYALIGRISRG